MLCIQVIAEELWMNPLYKVPLIRKPFINLIADFIDAFIKEAPM